MAQLSPTDPRITKVGLPASDDQCSRLGSEPRSTRADLCASPCRHLLPQAWSVGPEVGPGTYETDPLADHTTGLPTFVPGKSRHMVALEKYPDRPSPAFKSPER